MCFFNPYSTELPHDFCAGIGPLQLGVVLVLSLFIFGSILDDRLKETHSNHSLCVSVCLSVCARATGHIFEPGNLICGLNDPMDMRKKRIFVKIFIFRLFIDDLSICFRV